MKIARKRKSQRNGGERKRGEISGESEKQQRGIGGKTKAKAK
jgi:hypothetical protein